MRTGRSCDASGIGSDGATVALAHDYLTQRGGAERVVLSLTRAFPAAPVHTSLYEPAGTFPEFSSVDVRPLPINRRALLRRHHRLALPFLADAIDGTRVDADVLVASSSGWAHGIATSGRKIVYCHAPARWLYQTERYAAGGARERTLRSRAVTAATFALGPRLRRWDQVAAASADRYLVNSTVVQKAVAEVYGIEAEVLAPPPAAVGRAGEEREVPGIPGAFLLCVARLLPYKNVDLVIQAVARVPGLHVVVVGSGPEQRRLEELARRTAAATVIGRVPDDQLRWLYQNCVGLVAASFEDFGLSPVEAASFGKPTAALRDGGYLDTVSEGTTGVFFDQPDVGEIAEAVDALARASWSEESISTHAERFSEGRFIDRMHAIVAEELHQS
ncbi:glycosyltransferase [Microbacterium lacticum]|uniref:glycosyltransferase n=1 Tax=Microbacterium lacticum TaxID=33885 RepID=UPI00242AE798|nr:glycosyltransferase [Microbacterium lacticum]